MSLERLNPIYGRVVSECAQPAGAVASFVFQVCGVGGNELRIIASDFRSNTFQAIMSSGQLEDLRDGTGISGSWSDFLDYFTTSLGSDVKLILEDVLESEGASCAKIVSKKAKGLPKISIRLDKVVGAAAVEANAKLALELYREVNDLRHSLVEEQHQKDHLTKLLAAEQEKSSNLMKQLGMVMSPRKRHSMNINNGEKLDSSSTVVPQDLPDKHASGSPSRIRGTGRVLPAHRRSKFRGAVLDNKEDEA